MRLKEAVASALHLAIILVFFTLATFCFMLPFRSDWRSDLIGFLQDRPDVFYQAGALIAGVGILLMIGFFRMGRGHFLRLVMKPHMASVDVRLLQHVVDECFSQHFYRHVINSDIAIISKQRLEIEVDLVPMEQKSQLVLLKDMENKLGALLRDHFGYVRPFTLSIRTK
jgi:hypothetical protein